MNFEQRCTIPVAREELWNFLMDVPQMAACVPGVESVTPHGGDQYAGHMRVKVGPIGLNLSAGRGKATALSCKGLRPKVA